MLFALILIGTAIIEILKRKPKALVDFVSGLFSVFVREMSQVTQCSYVYVNLFLGILFGELGLIGACWLKARLNDDDFTIMLWLYSEKHLKPLHIQTRS